MDEWTIKTIYIGCSAVGTAVLMLQMLLLFLGGDADVDADVDIDVDGSGGGDGLSFLSIRSIAGFLTFFGLSGWWGSVADWGTTRTLAVATGAGLLMMLAVAWMMSLHSKLYSEGNVQPENALGKSARVYLRVPGENAGKGKITVSIQGRSLEFDAVTKGKELPTGSDVRIVGMVTENTFEIVALD